MRRMLALFMSMILIMSACVIIPAASAEALPMWVYTENGKTLNVRSAPVVADNIIGRLKYGELVMVEFINSTGWAVILYKDGEAYVQARFLLDYQPGPKPTQSPEDKEAQEMKNEQAKLNKELASERDLTEPFYLSVRATRTTGWINFRVGPSKITTRVSSFPDGKQLIAIGETANWYRARDPETGKTGYIHKNYVTKQAPVASVTPAEQGKQSLGKLNVGGEFELVCAIPETYSLQVVNVMGTRITASILSDDMTKPQLFLNIAYDETYGDVERLNDLNDADLAVLENSFTEMNQVEITYRQTGYGTKLLVARETGSDTDFVGILTIYKGYFIEFNMAPNPNSSVQTLTDEQIKMCIDFLTELDFNQPQK
ncbi:MAG: SH3 domain-containing protein [Clostridia bacterium]|nr:SH3 domain-containing protein [Clostridia bacterium]